MTSFCKALIFLAAFGLAVSCGHHSPPDKPTPLEERGPDASIPSEGTEAASPPALSLPMEALTRFDIEHEHGCSQSFENTGISGSAKLAAGADGAASFTLEWSRSTLLGPSVGSYMEGARDYTRTRSKHRFTWNGRARVDGEGLLFEFNGLEASSVDLPEYGDLPFPDSDSGTTALTIRCDPSVVDAYPPPGEGGLALAMPAEGESPRRAGAMACAPSAELFDMANLVLVDGKLMMSPGDGLIVASWTMWWDSRQVIRLAPPTSRSPGTP